MSGKAKSLADQAYETIKQNILNLTYPPGMPLTEAKLAEELGMSRRSGTYRASHAADRWTYCD